MPILTGDKWGASQVNGTYGGVVTWSLIDSDIPGVRNTFDTNRNDRTDEVGVDLGFDVVATLSASFAEWSRIANIDFVQIEDGNGNVGQGRVADIRIAFGELDGAFGDTLALAFFPDRIASPTAGDILFDSEETNFFSDRTDFRAVAVHEIGHSIGLDHITGVSAIMNPTIGRFSRPQADDIRGVREIYGFNQDITPEIDLTAGQPDITILQAVDGLRIDGTVGDNVVVGGKGDEFINGRNGSDDLRGLGGSDTIFGGGNSDELRGGSGRDSLDGGGNADFLNGNGGRDILDGNRGRDTINGAGGSDTIDGGGGKDRINGQFGDDVLTGGNGPDVFVFTRLGGQDTVTDFSPDQDRLDYTSHSAVRSLNDLEFTDTGAGVLIGDGAGGSVLLEGVLESDLSAGDFIF